MLRSCPHEARELAKRRVLERHVVAARLAAKARARRQAGRGLDPLATGSRSRDGHLLECAIATHGVLPRGSASANAHIGWSPPGAAGPSRGRSIPPVDVALVVERHGHLHPLALGNVVSSLSRRLGTGASGVLRSGSSFRDSVRSQPPCTKSPCRRAAPRRSSPGGRRWAPTSAPRLDRARPEHRRVGRERRADIGDRASRPGSALQS